MNTKTDQIVVSVQKDYSFVKEFYLIIENQGEKSGLGDSICKEEDVTVANQWDH